ncbi:acyl-CoA synthetase [Pollutimonas harenae]|uniref:AMP-binding protein n=1 Tax=Pollutimonas harenae TaxID=657015 RepID=A0A853H640_9BURK|nr:AMP-binding protein [Pollutimonas harenae]NYT85574.1 AMP-binding protein [Pollutimonas harenae]TEA70657.1 acetyl-CoA synthetase [Pollutimonas harenae]
MNDQYSALYQSYQWFVPSQFNIAQACVHRWAQNPLEGRRIAIFHENAQGQREVWTYTRLSDTANQLANGLIKMGIQAGDRIAVLTEQRPEAVAAYTAIFSVGAIVVPLSPGYNTDELAACLQDANIRIAIVDAACASNLLLAQNKYSALSQIIGLDFQHEAIIPWHSLLARQPTSFKPLPTSSGSPALLLYAPDHGVATPKGILLAHRTLIGVLPGFVASQNWFPQAGDVFWSPSGWQSADGLMNALLPTLYFGHAIVSTIGQFTPVLAFEIMERYQVSNAFLTPAALSALMHDIPQPRSQYKLSLRAMTINGTGLDEDIFQWCQDALDITPNQEFGQAETNQLIGNSHKRWPAKPGSMGRPYPGHHVAVLDNKGKPCPPGKTGEIALNRYDLHGHIDPLMFLGYWRNDEATLSRFQNDWYLTGELAQVDDDGYYWYAGRRKEPQGTAQS